MSVVNGKEYAGMDLSSGGITEYMWDVIYIGWFVQIGSVLSQRVWWTYAGKMNKGNVYIM